MLSRMRAIRIASMFLLSDSRAAARLGCRACVRLEHVAQQRISVNQAFGSDRPRTVQARIHDVRDCHRHSCSDATVHGDSRVDRRCKSSDPQAENTALSLMASPATTLRRIVLPQLTPGILSGSLMVFGLSASAFAIPGLLGGRRLKVAATAVYDEFLGSLNWPLGATIALLLLVANLIVMLTYYRVLERQVHQKPRLIQHTTAAREHHEKERFVALIFHTLVICGSCSRRS